MTKNDSRKNIGKILKQRRSMANLTLFELSKVSGVSPSYMGRIENGDRFPSASILQKLAKPLGFSEDELFTLAGFLTPRIGTGGVGADENKNKLDPDVAKLLAMEPVEVQRAIIGILSILKGLAVVTVPLRNPMITPDLFKNMESQSGKETDKS
jgi:transcriptional regulator with XRE-family HTH domain